MLAPSGSVTQSTKHSEFPDLATVICTPLLTDKFLRQSSNICCLHSFVSMVPHKEARYHGNRMYRGHITTNSVLNAEACPSTHPNLDTSFPFQKETAPLSLASSKPLNCIMCCTVIRVRRCDRQRNCRPFGKYCDSALRQRVTDQVVEKTGLSKLPFNIQRYLRLSQLCEISSFI